MIRTIARKELVDMMRDGRFRLTAVVLVVLLLVALAAGWRHVAGVHAQHEQARVAMRTQWLGQGKKNPHSAAHYGVYAFKPHSQLALVDSGVDPYVGVAVWLEAHKQNDFKYRPAQDRTALQRFGELTAAAVLQLLVPLCIVLLAFPAFAGEREHGTLRQLLSLGVRPRDLALGKALGIAGALGLVLLPATVLGVAALALTADDGLLAGDLTRAGLLAAAYLAYFGVILALSLAVSARAASSRLALVILLAFWMFNSLIATRAVSDLAGALHPTPSAVRFALDMQRELSETVTVKERIARRTNALMVEYGVTTEAALPVNLSGVSLQEGEEHGNEVFDRHYGRLFGTFERQNAVYQLGGLVAPMLAVRAVSMALAGTDFAQHRHFTDAAETYRRGIQRVMNDDILHHAKPRAAYQAGDELWSKVPAFTYVAPSTWWALANAGVSVMALGVWLAAAVLLVVRGARRMQVA